MSRYRFFDTIFNYDENYEQKGLMNENIKELFSSDIDIKYQIPKEHEFRPDLIADKFYKNPKLYWILVYVNEFSKCPEDFTEGKIIRVPHYNKVSELI